MAPVVDTENRKENVQANVQIEGAKKRPKARRRDSFMVLEGTALNEDADKAAEDLKHDKRLRRSYLDAAITGNVNLDRAIMAFLILFQGSVLLFVHMFLVYVFGSWSIPSYVMIYAPVTLMTLILIRDKYHPIAIVSACIAISHGCMHLTYPFLDEVKGVVHDVDVWQDQVVHSTQALLFGAVWFNKMNNWGKLALLIFILGNVLNIALGYHCWNDWCYPIYVWVSLFPAVAGGLHFACAAMLKCPPGVGKWLCAFQGVQTIFFFFFFKNSDEMLKLFAATRFFEIYNIVPHYIGFINGRLDMYFQAQEDCKSPMKHLFGLERTPTNKRRHSAALESFFPVESARA